MEELEYSIKRAKLGKAPGEDGIPVEYFKALPNNWKEYILSLFNKALSSGSTPASWSRVIISMLYKNKRDKDDPNNYRPIALVNVLVKLFTLIICRRLSSWAEDNSLLPEFQSGFRTGRRCMDNIFVLNALIQRFLSEVKGKIFALFVDFRRAFPSVSHALL